jgi:hypothetical protein
MSRAETPMIRIASLFERVARWWDTPAKAATLASLRIAIGGFALIYLLVRSSSLLSVTAFGPTEFRPVGVVSLLANPLSAVWVHAIAFLALASGLAFVCGVGFRLAGPVFAALLLWVTSYRSSWGMIFHTDNLLVLHVLVLAISPAADALSWDAHRRARAADVSETAAVGGALAEHFRYGWPARTMAILTVSTYVLAGVAKLKLSGGAWLGGELLRSHIAYDNLRKLELGSGVSVLGVWFVRHPTVFAPLAVMTMLVELGAPLALLHRRAALVWCVAAWSFHLGVALLMGITFFYPLFGVAYLPLFRLEGALARLCGERSWPFLRRARGR